MKVSILEQSVSVEGKPQSVTIKEYKFSKKSRKTWLQKILGFRTP